MEQLNCYGLALLKELKFLVKQAVILFCVNLDALYLANDLVFQACTKHMEVDLHFI